MKNYFYRAGAWATVTAAALLPVAASAQLSKAKSELEKVAPKLSDAPKQLPELIGNLINIFLSVLGIIFVVMVVYAGYLWMTDAGGGEKVKKAKSLLGTAIIGIIITLAAYAIANFVINALVEGVAK